MASNPFKQCPCCTHTWQTRDEFLGDENLRLIGYQPDFDSLEFGLFLFTHEVKSCGSSLAMREESQLFRLFPAAGVRITAAPAP